MYGRISGRRNAGRVEAYACHEELNQFSTAPVNVLSMRFGVTGERISILGGWGSF
jgi:hypothetical protein